MPPMCITARYRHYRAAGYSPVDALRQARILARFRAAETAGLVRLRWAPDECCNLADLEGDTFDEPLNAATVPGGVRTIRAEREAFHRRIDREGVWGLIGEYRVRPDGAWSRAESVWGFVGQDSYGYEFAIMAETLRVLRDTLKSRCPRCSCCRQPRPAPAQA